MTVARSLGPGASPAAILMIVETFVRVSRATLTSEFCEIPPLRMSSIWRRFWVTGELGSPAAASLAVASPAVVELAVDLIVVVLGPVPEAAFHRKQRKTWCVAAA
jgi:hypothetical protein